MKANGVSAEFRRIVRRQCLAAHLRAGALVVAIAVVVLLVSGGVLAQSVASPHWNKGACRTCHEQAVPDAAHAALRSPNADALCAECHGDGAEGGTCRHVSDVAPGDLRIPDSYRAALHNGHVTCTTCHELKVQCLAPSQSYRFMNPGFIRERSSSETSDHCYTCHEAGGFEKLNPHDAEGDTSCILCHATKPTRGPDGKWFPVNFVMRDDLNDTCRGCHPVRPHPSDAFSGVAPGWDHLAVPSDRILARMREMESATGATLPLEPGTGKIHCATCHDPHGDLEGYAKAAAPGATDRLRIEHMCQACHEK
jgi:predicted CXXCH cytochrome family protein